MDSLPPEILSEIAKILSYDSPGQLRTYAAISIPWQMAVERQTFHSLTFNIAEIDTFRLFFDSEKLYRTQFLFNLNIELGDRCDAADHTRDETVETSEAMSQLINVLASITAKESKTPPLALSFYDHGHNNCVGISDIILSDTDPLLQNVESLTFFNVSPSWKSRAIFGIAKNLPKMRKMTLVLYDVFRSGHRERRIQRKELGDAFCKIDVSELQELNLGVRYRGPSDEDWKGGSLLPETGSRDDTYLQIYRHLSVSPCLKILRLTGPIVVGVDLFANMPNLPSLSEFQLDFAASTADGAWFFVKDEHLAEDTDSEDSEDSLSTSYMDADMIGWWDRKNRDTIMPEDSEDEDGPLLVRDDKSNYYRTLPNPDVVPGFLSDAASFLRASPRLRKFILRFRESFSENHTVLWNHDDMDRVLEVWFLRQGTPRNYPGYYPQVLAEEKILDWNRLYWRVGERWRPDDRVMQAWRNATGPKTKVLFLDEKRWQEKDCHWLVYLGDLEDDLANPRA